MSMSTFGKTTVGASFVTVAANSQQAVGPFSAVAGSVTKISIYQQGGGTSSQAFKAAIWRDAGDRSPGRLLGATPGVTVASGAAAGWVDYTFTTPISVNAGNYWLGYIAGTTTLGAKVFYDATTTEDGLRFVNTGIYANGPSDPFGASTSVDDHFVSIQATLTVPAGWQTGVTLPRDVEPVYTTGSIGDPPLSIQDSALQEFFYDDGFAYVPRLRTVQKRTFRTDGLPGDDGFNFQASQVTLVE